MNKTAFNFILIWAGLISLGYGSWMLRTTPFEYSILLGCGSAAIAIGMLKWYYEIKEVIASQKERGKR